MARKVIIDCDPGIGDAVALCLALFDPRLEVIAVTAVEGQVRAGQASLNAQAIVDLLDPPRLPRLGTATAPDNAPTVNTRPMQGDDGLANSGLAVAQLHHQHPSEKILCDEIRTAPELITVVCLGPLTNLARALQRDPSLAGIIGHVVIAGGSPNCIGDVTPAAEFNMFYDPLSARAVFRAPLTKTLVPLDVTDRVRLTLDLVDQLPDETSRAGRLLRRLLPFSFRAHRQHLGQESIILSEAVALAAVLHPELFELEEMKGDVETKGELTVGATIFDRRANSHWQASMAVVTEVDVVAVRDFLLRGVAQAARAT